MAKTNMRIKPLEVKETNTRTKPMEAKKKSTRTKPMEVKNGKYRLDEANLSILDELNTNARMKIPEIGRRVGLTRNSVYRRIEEMESAGIIVGYTVDVDWSLVDLSK